MPLSAQKKICEKSCKTKNLTIFAHSKRFLLADGQRGLIGNPVWIRNNACCCKFHFGVVGLKCLCDCPHTKLVRNTLCHWRPSRWEGVTNGISQKTYPLPFIDLWPAGLRDKSKLILSVKIWFCSASGGQMRRCLIGIGSTAKGVLS
jgi:hypothetical protein